MEIGIILSNPTPATPNIMDDVSASIAIKGNITIAKIKQIPKLCRASPSGLDKGSTRPEWRPDESLAPKILIKLPHSPENSGINVSRLGFVSNVSTAPFNIPPAEHPKNEHKSSTGEDCDNIVLVSSDSL